MLYEGSVASILANGCKESVRNVQFYRFGPAEFAGSKPHERCGQERLPI